MKKKSKSQVWSKSMTILPSIVLVQVGMNVTHGFTANIPYALLGAVLGVTIGAIANHLSKDRSLLIKIVSSIVLILICGLAMKYAPLISLKIEEKEEREIIEQKWVKQQIGGITFESPTKLLLRPIELPKDIKEFYLEFKLHSVTSPNKERVIKFLNTQLTEKAVTMLDTVSIERMFLDNLGEILQGDLGVDLSTLELEPFIKSIETISTTFYFKANGKRMQGYGFLLKKGNIMDVIWLIPIYKGFSDEYIEKFKKGVVSTRTNWS